MTIALTAMLSNAASIQWSVANNTIRNLDGTANLANASLYFFVGTATAADVLAAFTKVGDSWTFDSSKLVDDPTPILLGTGVSTGGGGKGIGSTVYENSAISESALNPFFCVVVIDGYYQIGSLSAKGYDATNVANSPTTAAFTSFGGWQKVPEPATAALALAGLALLIRRRK